MTLAARAEGKYRSKAPRLGHRRGLAWRDLTYVRFGVDLKILELLPGRDLVMDHLAGALEKPLIRDNIVPDFFFRCKTNP